MDPDQQSVAKEMQFPALSSEKFSDLPYDFCVRFKHELSKEILFTFHLISLLCLCQQSFKSNAPPQLNKGGYQLQSSP